MTASIETLCLRHAELSRMRNWADEASVSTSISEAQLPSGMLLTVALDKIVSDATLEHQLLEAQLVCSVPTTLREAAFLAAFSVHLHDLGRASEFDENADFELQRVLCNLVTFLARETQLDLEALASDWRPSDSIDDLAARARPVVDQLPSQSKAHEAVTCQN